MYRESQLRGSILESNRQVALCKVFHRLSSQCDFDLLYSMFYKSVIKPENLMCHFFFKIDIWYICFFIYIYYNE